MFQMIVVFLPKGAITEVILDYDLNAIRSFHVKSTQENPYPHRFGQKLVLTQCQLRH